MENKTPNESLESDTENPSNATTPDNLERLSASSCSAPILAADIAVGGSLSEGESGNHVSFAHLGFQDCGCNHSGVVCNYHSPGASIIRALKDKGIREDELNIIRGYAKDGDTNVVVLRGEAIDIINRYL